MKSGLLFSRFFVAVIGAIDFQTIGIKLSLKVTNASVQSLHFTLLLQDFRFRFRKHVISVSLEERFYRLLRLRESE